MRIRLVQAALAFVWLAALPAASRAADEATSFRVFLKDGQSLVSYGEYARVGDRVVFSMPIAASANPPLHLVDLPAAAVDWTRTERYADAARAARYLATQAEVDYAALTNHVADTLNLVAVTTDPARRLAVVERARQTLADWPRAHYNFRGDDVRQMLMLLDEAIADLRAATGGARFALSFVADVAPPPAEPLLPLPTPKEAIEQTLLAARLTDLGAERTALLGAVIVALDRDAVLLPADWTGATRAQAKRALDDEVKIDRQYQGLVRLLVGDAERRARDADVRGVEQILGRIPERDAALGGRRPDAVTSLVGAVQAQLDAAQRLRLERDHWTLRAPLFHKYSDAVRRPIDLLARLRPSLEDIKALAGSTPLRLEAIERATAQISALAGAVVPPDECRAVHALIVSAAELAGSAARIRLEATRSKNLSRAWDASSAAAGALMLAARVQADLQTLLRPPQAK